MALYTRDNARRSLIDTVSYRAISQLATALGYVVLVRGMTVEDFGVFNLLYAFIPVVSTFASFGLEQTLRRYQPEYLRAGNTAAAAWLVRFVASARFGTNVILLSVILLAWNYFAPLLKLTPYRAEFAFFCILVLLHFQASILQLTLASHMLHRFGVGSTVVLAIVKLAGYSSLVWLSSLTLERTLLIDTIGYAAAYVLMRVAYHKRSASARSAEKFRPDKTERKRLLRYGLFNNFNDVGSLVLSTNTDSFFIAAFIDPVSVGVYAFYNRLSWMMGNLSPVRLFDNVVQPMFFAMRPEDADQRAPQYFSLLLNLSLLLQWPVLTYATSYHEELVRVVFGGKFIEYSWLLPMVVFFATLNVISTPATLIAQYEEKAGAILLSKIFALYNVIALLILIPLAGLYGAVLANGTGQTFKNLFIWWHVRRRARWLQGTRAFLSSLTIWGGALAACYTVKTLVHMPALAQLLVGAAICGSAMLIHLRSPSISASDRTLLGSLMRGKEIRILRMVGLVKPAVGEHLG